jgi:hypothetical protein
MVIMDIIDIIIIDTIITPGIILTIIPDIMMQGIITIVDIIMDIHIIDITAIIIGIMDRSLLLVLVFKDIRKTT